ncbi:Sensor histidine kinase/response regulator [Pseudomonas syringae pv. antirrhini]|uniref:histidine kinase n=1 Tax=Pseudomonas syringae pv. antirrhini TaxID=251702 RepID=A0A0P9LGF4_9PSED|nr:MULTISPECIES: response regulator [Pseudomonas]KPW43250.1 Sensor histidine kinase/response regulator [Pseudomonas syringae pv. antirrhini]RMP34090.1 Sensor histidine kinase/response regulator [Pseudomonas syringae pv. antirrhini]RMP39404.1 Sensor histidine kinase/response regulator [Pseudomonas syringae pv. antirrhini]RMW25129.1 Sensor histidine kinase/response regulator [Pseudomonas syringae pv. antirrhini]WIN09558.1 response regulator [Pseudomonas syringae pv. antirrhini str. 126]
MNRTPSVDEQRFRKLLGRNVGLPLGVGVLSAVFFILLISYLLNAIQWVEHTDRVINNTNRSMKLSIDMETGMRGFLLTGDQHFLDPYEIAKPLLVAELNGLQDLVQDNPTQQDRFRRLFTMQQEWNVFAQDMIDLRRNNGDFQTPVLAGRGKRITDQIRTEYEQAVEMEQQLRLTRNAEVTRSTVISVTLYLIFVVIVSGILAYIGRRDLLSLSATYSANLRQQEVNAERLQKVAWLRNGQSELAEQVLGQLTLNMLGRNILQFLTQYLGASVAAMYIRQDHGGLTRAASYGFSREQEQQDQTIHSDEGVVGQAASQDRIITLDELPENYFKVASGLGEGSPRSVVVVPISNDDQVNGVVELGFLRPLTEQDVEFLELVSDNIGTSIEAARYRQRLQEVLAETQQLNEELQVQQEELRTANEELEEQSRILKESQAHLETQQAELEQTNEQLAEQSQALADQRDALDRNNEELNIAQGELQARADELQRASKYKSEFLANMSHELRTPLNSSLILAKLLAENPSENLTAEQVKFAESIYSAGNDLLNLINDILDISKVEAGKLEVRPENSSVSRLVEGLRGLFQPLAAEKKLAFTVDIQAGAPTMLFTDRQRLEQILKNLLSNAIKFTEAGAVSMVVSRQPGAGIVFSVRDSGIGIAEEHQQGIFEAFRQADGTTNRRYGGTGLGLSISRDLAALLGGSISVTSAPGQGSIFTLVLPEQYVEQDPQAPGSEPLVMHTPAVLQLSVPAAPVIQPPLPAPVETPIAVFADDRDKAPFERRCILVIEDEVRFAQILFDLAHELGYDCLVAHAADDGFNLASRYTPDAILLDMRLPDHSGLTVLQRLKELAPTRHIPVHVISVEDRQEAALHMGAIGYAVKPTTREELKDVFAKLEAKLTQKVKRILLVEDDDLQRDSIARLIGDDDIEITAVGFAQQALDLLRDHIYDCMIIDLKLPDMLGNELLKRMSTEDICAFPPVIVYTGRNMTRDEEAELMKYSRSIIIKGARSPERLLDEVTLFLHKVESQLSSERQKMLKTARSRDKVFEARKILVVDDDVRNIFALTSALEHKGAVVEIARNGLEAIAKLNEVEDIDLVLMDVMMPEMDGYEATIEIRKDPRWRKLPIIAVTAKAMKDDQERCLQAGSNDYLAKPIDLDRLFSLIRVWLPKMERI